MKKPDRNLVRLVELGCIHGLYIDQRVTGSDTAETHVRITGSNGKAEGLWKSYRDYLELRPTHNAVCVVKKELVEKVRAQKEFEEMNRKEIEEYERLKKKFNG